MAKSMTVGKRENEKKRLAKREAKLKRKEGRKSTKSSFDDMIAYVDEYGMITSTPPEENIKKQEINVEEIMISTPRKEDEEPVILRGRIEFFNEARGFGFIKDLAGIEKAVPRLRRGGVHQYNFGAENSLRCLCDVLQRAENLQCAGKR